jgi:hypothetical protein
VYQKRIALTTIFSFILIFLSGTAFAAANGEWEVGIGFTFFKFSSEGKPKEIDYNKVFDRWEQISRDKENYDTQRYQPLKPLYFTFAFGIDIFTSYENKLMMKLSYDISDPAGMGGKGMIKYTDKRNGITIEEKKEFTYTSKQINYFFGPISASNDSSSEIYMGFSPMSPTWVKYRERYSRTENNVQVRQYDKTFKGMFGNCRSLIGIQNDAANDLKLGAEQVHTFLNFMRLISDDGIVDSSFQFPGMKWNFTIRKNISN